MTDPYAWILKEWQEFGFSFNRPLVYNGRTYKAIRQFNKELEPTFAWIAARLNAPVSTFVELGVDMGGTLFLYSALVRLNGMVVGADMGPYPADHPVHKVVERIRLNKRCELVVASTRAAIDTVKRWCPNGIELLHIDASHDYAHVSDDWRTYSPLVKKGGLILFHDTWQKDGVARLWREVSKGADAKEFVIPYGAGIGCLVKP